MAESLVDVDLNMPSARSRRLCLVVDRLLHSVELVLYGEEKVLGTLSIAVLLGLSPRGAVINLAFEQLAGLVQLLSEGLDAAVHLVAHLLQFLLDRVARHFLGLGGRHYEEEHLLLLALALRSQISRLVADELQLGLGGPDFFLLVHV